MPSKQQKHLALKSVLISRQCSKLTVRDFLRKETLTSGERTQARVACFHHGGNALQVLAEVAHDATNFRFNEITLQVVAERVLKSIN